MTHYVTYHSKLKNGWGVGWCTLVGADFTTRAGIEAATQSILDLNADVESVVILNWQALDE